MVMKLMKKNQRKKIVIRHYHKYLNGKKKRESKIMAADVLLIICPAWGVERLPLGLAQIYTYIKTKGITVELLDLNIELFNQASPQVGRLWNVDTIEFWMNPNKVSQLIEHFRKELSSLFQNIRKQKYKCIGFSVNSGNRLFSYKLAQEIKALNNNIVLVAGGMGVFTMNDILTLSSDNPFDFFVVGEGEETFYELVKNILNNENNFEHIQSLVFYKGSEYITTKKRSLLDNLDGLPFLDLSQFNLENYREKQIPLISSSGCINKCAFCNDCNMWPKYRSKSSKRIFEELAYYVEVYGITNFVFHDLAINGNLRILEDFCSLVFKYKLNVSWAGYATIRPDMSDELVERIKYGQGHTLCFGIDSFSNNVLKKMRKRYLVEDAVRILKSCKKNGIKTIVNIIVGFPGETEKDFEETLLGIEENIYLIDEFGSINLCDVNEMSDLCNQPDNYDIIAYSGPFSFNKWHTRNNDNNLVIRKKRLDRLLSMLKSKNVTITSNNVIDSISLDI